jgi:quercetin 2,3-dioxygenase
VRGAIDLNGQRLATGDGAATSDERELALRAESGGAEVLLFDLR